MTSESTGSDWDSQILIGNEFQTLGAENRKARDPNVKTVKQPDFREDSGRCPVDECRHSIGRDHGDDDDECISMYV